MSESNDYYKSVLAKNGIKSTRQRTAVLKVLRRSDVPLTAEEIFLKIHGGANNLSLSTVYRILDTLMKNNLVSKSSLMEGGRTLFEATYDIHRHNLICVKCRRIIPICDCPLTDYESGLERTTGYKITGHKLEVYGVCPKCENKEFQA